MDDDEYKSAGQTSEEADRDQGEPTGKKEGSEPYVFNDWALI